MKKSKFKHHRGKGKNLVVVGSKATEIATHECKKKDSKPSVTKSVTKVTLRSTH